MLAAALCVADRTGPDAMSMRGVAAEVGVAPMSLYHHVRDRNDLLGGMVDHLLGELPDVADGGGPWTTRLRSLFVALRYLAHAHPRTVPLVLRYPDSPQLGRLRTAGAEAVADAGVPVAHLAQTEGVVWTLVLGFVVREALAQFRDLGPGGADQVASAVFAAVVQHVIWVAADPTRAHPEDPDLAWSLSAHADPVLSAALDEHQQVA